MINIKKNRINFDRFLAKYLLLICLFYSPFVFFAFVNDIVRLTAFVLLLFFLFSKSLLQKISLNQVFKNVISLGLVFIYCGASLYINMNSEGFRSAIGYSLILFLSYLLYVLIYSNFVFYTSLLDNYIKIIYLILFSVIINFLFNLFFSSANFLTSYFPNNFSYDYSASVFGLSIKKVILGINISRNFWFFIEPVYTAPFYLINIFLIGPLIQFKNKWFIRLNVISGLLSFSYLFFIGYAILYLLKNKPYYLSFILSIISILIVYLNFDFEGASLVTSSSSSDRLLRMDLALEVLSKFSLSKLLLGSGYLFSQSLEMGVSAGIFSSFIEGGLIGMIIPFILCLIYTNFNKLLFCIVILSLLVVEPYKMPYFWITILIVGKLYNLKADEK